MGRPGLPCLCILGRMYESSWFAISLYEKLFSFVVNETVFVQSFNEEFYTSLDVTSNVSVASSVELSIVKLS